MKTIKVLFLLFTIILVTSCKKSTNDEKDYLFVKPYCATVTVGGVVGIAEKCFKLGDSVKGTKTNDGSIRVRIAAHSAVNDGPPSSSSFQEFLNIPSQNLKLVVD